MLHVKDDGADDHHQAVDDLDDPPVGDAPEKVMERIAQQVAAAGGRLRLDEQARAYAVEDGAVDRHQQQVIGDKQFVGEEIELRRHDRPDKARAQQIARAVRNHRQNKDGDIEDNAAHPQRDGGSAGALGKLFEHNRKTRHAAGDQSARVIDILRSCGDQRRAQKHQDKVPQVPSPAWFPVSGGFYNSCGLRVLSGFFHTSPTGSRADAPPCICRGCG